MIIDTSKMKFIEEDYMNQDGSLTTWYFDKETSSIVGVCQASEEQQELFGDD